MEDGEKRQMTGYPDFSAIRAEMNRRGFRFTRRWGQNFLTNRSLLDFIVAEAGIGEGDLVLEIGTGPGCLTGVLLHTGARVIGVEIDAVLHEIGRTLVLTDAVRQRMVWICGDFLEGKHGISAEVESALDQQLSLCENPGFKVVSNLPYCIATPAIMNLLESRHPWTVMIVMVQEEVAERFTALPGSHGYSTTSVLASELAEVTRLKKIRPGSFWPKPEVDSAILKLEFRAAGDRAAYARLKALTRMLFAHRRKTWSNSLKTSLKSSDPGPLIAAAARAGIDPGARAQHLSREEIVALCTILAPLVAENGGDN